MMRAAGRWVVSLLLAVVGTLSSVDASITVSPLEVRFSIEGSEPQNRTVRVLNTGEAPLPVRMTVSDFGVRDGRATVGVDAGKRSLRPRVEVFPTEAVLAPGESIEVRIVLNPDREVLAAGTYWTALMVEYGGRVEDPNQPPAENTRRFSVSTTYRILVAVFGDVDAQPKPFPADVEVTDMRMEEAQLVIDVSNQGEFVRGIGSGRVVLTATDGRQEVIPMPPGKLYPGHVRPVRIEIPESFRGKGEVGFLVEFDTGAVELVGAEAVFEP